MSSNSNESLLNTEKFSHLQKTPLLIEHLKLEAKVVDFGGWALPVNYGSQVDEHHAVRQDIGMFDVSHMTVSDIIGKETIDFLKYLLANDIDKASSSGKAIYSCMLNENAGVIDDLIVYRINDEHCRLVTNAATNKKDMAWINHHAKNFDITFHERSDLALIAIQGPNAIERTASIFTEHQSIIESLARFQGQFDSSEVHDENSVFIGRTGYTGEDGLELIIPAHKVVHYWQSLIQFGVQPCGLGARDTLRLEAGMALYGNDLDEKHSPLESGLKWTVSLTDRDFIGKAVLQEEKPLFKMIGLILEDRGVLRSHQSVISEDKKIGEITSGTFSPTLQKSIALARINSSSDISIGDRISVEVRNKLLSCQVVKYPFI